MTMIKFDYDYDYDYDYDDYDYDDYDYEYDSTCEKSRNNHRIFFSFRYVKRKNSGRNIDVVVNVN